MSHRTFLSVNVNKIAVLRNSRGGQWPDPLAFAHQCLQFGADGITVHPRPDERHIRADDVLRIAELCRESNVEFNIEGNPAAPARGNYPGLLALCEAARPAQVTFVPDGDGQITSDHGFDFDAEADNLRILIPQYKALGARVSVFADAETPSFGLVKTLGADRIELYTGPYADAFEANELAEDIDMIAVEERLSKVLEIFTRAATSAQAAGLQVNAGHDLSVANLGYFLQAVPNVAEVSIGHALIAECLMDGLPATLSKYRALLG